MSRQATQSSEVEITYTPRCAPARAELDTLANALKFILFESQASKKGSRPAAPERPERIKDDPASARSIPE
jgi:hypothetical protein